MHDSDRGDVRSSRKITKNTRYTAGVFCLWNCIVLVNFILEDRTRRKPENLAIHS